MTTEVMAARSAGARAVKLFPAVAAGGRETVTALSAPFPGVLFVPTGGIAQEEVADYLALPGVVVVGAHGWCPWSCAPSPPGRG